MSTEKKSTRRKESRSNRVIHLTVRKIHAAKKNNLQTVRLFFRSNLSLFFAL